MNERINNLIEQSGFGSYAEIPNTYIVHKNDLVEFAELIVEATLDQVKERAYYTGDRDWSDEVDRPWIQLEFGYGKLQDAKNGIFK